jgi:hypothetical protein
MQKDKRKIVISYKLAKFDIRKIQESLFKPPERKEITKMVNKVIDTNQLKGTKVERYFYLWAVCTLLGKETLYSFWKKDWKSRAKEDLKRFKESVRQSKDK